MNIDPFVYNEALRRILQAQESGATQLDLSDLGIKCLPSEISTLTALRSLDLRCCQQLTDLRPLSGLTALEYLDLSWCGQLHDLSPLSGLAALNSVSLVGSALLDCLPGAQPLASWIALEFLYADHLKGAPLEPASCISRLELAIPSLGMSGDNALPRIRAWQADLAAGEAPNNTVKVLNRPGFPGGSNS